MSVKLITSEAYVNKIRSFLTEKLPSKSPEKSNEIFNKIISSSNFIFNKDENSDEYKKITSYITTLVSIRPGRVLFKRLLKADKPLKFVFDPNKHPSCNNDGTIATVTLDDSKTYHLISVNSNGEKFFTPTPTFIVFAHELIHALHHLEEGQEAVRAKKISKGILDPEFDDREEQETIMGDEDEMSLCENVFRFHFGYPLRINHRGLGLEKGPFTVSECACMGVLANLKERLLTDYSLLNHPQPIRSSRWWEKHGGLPVCHQGNKLPKVTPLNISLFKRQVEIVDYLYQCGVDINAQDKHWGSALHFAIKEGRLGLAKTLLNMGASVKAKDPSGLTALRLAFKITSHESQWFGFDDVSLCHDQKDAIELLAPLSDLKEIDEQGLSILHHAMNIGSLEGFRALIRYGADVNCKDLEGKTPLMESIPLLHEDFGCISKFEILLESDQLDLNAKNTNGETALFLAVHAKKDWKVNALVKKGAEVPPDLEEKVKQCIDRINSLSISDL